MPSNAQPGHRGMLLLDGVEVTGVRGATINRNLRNAEVGGWGDNHDYAVPVQPGVPIIEVEDPLWDPDDPAVEDLIASMESGGTAIAHLYPFGQDADYTRYWTGTFILEDPQMELTSEEGIVMPFSLKAAASDFTSVGIGS